MKVIQVVAGISAEASGPSYSVPKLVEALNGAGAEAELDVLAPLPGHELGCPVVSYRVNQSLIPNLGRSRALLCGLAEKCKTAEIIHNNGLWMMPNVYAAKAKKGTACKLVMAPRGCLAPWALAKGGLKKKVFGALFQYPALRAADMFHATSEKEYEEIRAFGLKQPVAIVPIGMEIPQISIKQSDQSNNQTIRTLAFFGRVHQVKSIDTMLLAWKMVADQFPGWRVVIAGPDCGDRSRLDGIIAERQIPRVEFIGELNGQAKYDFLASADLYCLPSKTENFGITVAEALACGTPSLASGGTPWSLINEYKCGSWGFTSPEQLAPELNRLMSLSTLERKTLGENGQRLVKERLSWSAIGRRMLEAYEWLVHGGPVPDCVRVNYI